MSENIPRHVQTMVDQDNVRLTARDMQVIKDAGMKIFAYDTDHFFIAIPTIGGRKYAMPRPNLKMVRDHLMPFVNITPSGKYSPDQPTRYGEPSFLWLVGVCIHYDVRIINDKNLLKEHLKSKLMHMVLEVPKRYKDCEDKLRREELRSVVPQGAALGNVASMGFVNPVTPLVQHTVQLPLQPAVNRHITPASQIIPSAEGSQANTVVPNAPVHRSTQMLPPLRPRQDLDRTTAVTNSDAQQARKRTHSDVDSTSEAELEDDPSNNNDNGEGSSTSRPSHSSLPGQMGLASEKQASREKKRKTAPIRSRKGKERATSDDDEDITDESSVDVRLPKLKKQKRARDPVRGNMDIKAFGDDESDSEDSEYTLHTKRSARRLAAASCSDDAGLSPDEVSEEDVPDASTNESVKSESEDNDDVSEEADDTSSKEVGESSDDGDNENSPEEDEIDEERATAAVTSTVSEGSTFERFVRISQERFRNRVHEAYPLNSVLQLFLPPEHRSVKLKRMINKSISRQEFFTTFRRYGRIAYIIYGGAHKAHIQYYTAEACLRAQKAGESGNVLRLPLKYNLRHPCCISACIPGDTQDSGSLAPEGELADEDALSETAIAEDSPVRSRSSLRSGTRNISNTTAIADASTRGDRISAGSSGNLPGARSTGSSARPVTDQTFQGRSMNNSRPQQDGQSRSTPAMAPPDRAPDKSSSLGPFLSRCKSTCDSREANRTGYLGPGCAQSASQPATNSKFYSLPHQYSRCNRAA